MNQKHNMVNLLSAIGNILFCFIILITLSREVAPLSYTLMTSATRHTELQSPRITNWGSWGSYAYCYEGDYVVDVNLRVEKQQGFKDDTGLNAIRLRCRSLDGQREYEIQSAEKSWGDWDGWESCGSDAVATGFKLKVDPNGGPFKADYVAATDFKLLCSGPDSKYQTYGSGLLPWGTWSSERKCPSKTAVCGIQTQVEAYVKKDNTALNNVDIACCKINSPARECSPSYYWNFETDCRNGNNCTATYSARIEYNGEPIGTGKTWDFYYLLGFTFDLENAYKELLPNFRKFYFNNKIEGNVLEDLIYFGMNTPFVVQTTFLDCETKIESLVLECGSYSIYTKEHRCGKN